MQIADPSLRVVLKYETETKLPERKRIKQVLVLVKIEIERMRKRGVFALSKEGKTSSFATRFLSLGGVGLVTGKPQHMVAIQYGGA